MNEGSAIKRIMAIGQELVTDFLASGRFHTRTTPLTNGYHLVFAKVWDHTEVNACLYDFQVSAEPILVFGPDVYDPRIPGIDADIWLTFVSNAKCQFEITKSLDAVIMTAARRGTRLSSKTGNLGEGFCEPGITRTRKGTGFISESNPPEPIMPTRPQVTYLTSDQPK